MEAAILELADALEFLGILIFAGLFSHGMLTIISKRQ
jgi:hypothetical protein